MSKSVAVSSLLSTSTNIYKGHDRASFSIEPKDNGKKVINEIKQYKDSRMITAIEAVHRLYAFKLYSMSPPVLQMQVHLEGVHIVWFPLEA